MKAGITYRLESKVVRYEAALRAAGIEPVRVPPGSGISLDALDGLVLTGGADINPARYGQPREPECEEPDDARDEHEIRLLRKALARDLPVLAICRGMQVFNVAQGGTLIQHLPSVDLHRQAAGSEPGKHGAAHSIRVAEKTRLATIIGAGEHAVNSRHHQAVDRPGADLQVAAIASDGVIEAIERPGRHFAIAVQWHPEDRILVSDADRKLFEAFAAAMKSTPAGRFS